MNIQNKIKSLSVVGIENVASLAKNGYTSSYVDFHPPGSQLNCVYNACVQELGEFVLIDSKVWHNSGSMDFQPKSTLKQLKFHSGYLVVGMAMGHAVDCTHVCRIQEWCLNTEWPVQIL